MIRCFIAIDVPKLDKILELQTQIYALGKVRLVTPENLHFTLKFLGDIEENKVLLIKKMINTVDVPAFTETLVGLGAFPNPKRARIIWVGTKTDEISKISEIINVDLKTMFKSEKEHLAHLTVARAKYTINLESLLKKYNDFEFGQFFVDSIKIKKSVLTEKGPIHTDLETIKLKA